MRRARAGYKRPGARRGQAETWPTLVFLGWAPESACGFPDSHCAETLSCSIVSVLSSSILTEPLTSAGAAAGILWTDRAGRSGYVPLPPPPTPPVSQKRSLPIYQCPISLSTHQCSDRQCLGKLPAILSGTASCLWLLNNSPFKAPIHISFFPPYFALNLLCS